jgi:hypothetical protein
MFILFVIFIGTKIETAKINESTMGGEEGSDSDGPYEFDEVDLDSL